MTPADDLDTIRAAGLATGRYQTWRPTDGVPIRSTIGEPKFWRGPELQFVRLLAPWGLLDVPDVEGRRRYVRRLDRDAHRIVADLAAVARRHPGKPLVVLCFEDVHAGEVCHRRWFAEWWQERLGIDVPELTDEQQPRLF